MQNRLRQVKVILYALKKAYGLQGYLYRPIDNITSVTTGKQSIDYKIIPIRQSIILPSSEARKFIYDLGYMAAAKNFTYGGFFDKELRVVIVENRDLQGIRPNLNDYFAYGDTLYKIEKTILAEDNSAWVLHLQNVSAKDDIVVPDYVVENSVVVSGQYLYHSDFNNLPSYKNNTHEYYIWAVSNEEWYISPSRGNTGIGPIFGPNDEIQGDYGGATVVRIK